MFFPFLSQYRDRPVMHLGQCGGTAFFLAAADLIKINDQVFLVTENHAQAVLLFDYLKTLRHDCMLLPDWELMPYDTFRASKDIAAARNFVFYQLLSLSRWVVVTSMPAIIYKLPPKSFYLQHALILKKGQVIERQQLVDRLTEYGYQRTVEVSQPSEFALRGGIIDFYPPALEAPVRLCLEGNILETLRYFDPQTQKTLRLIDEITYLPAYEYPVDAISQARYLKNFRMQFDDRKSYFYQQLIEGQIPPGYSFFLPLTFETQLSFIEYLSSEALLIFPSDAYNLYKDIEQKAIERFNLAKISFGFTPFPPDKILISHSAFNVKITRPYRIMTICEDAEGTITLPIQQIEAFTQQPWLCLKNKVEERAGRWLFSFESPARAQLLVQKIEHLLGPVQQFHSITSFLASTDLFGWMLASFEQALYLPEYQCTLLPEAHLYNQKVTVRSRNRLGSSTGVVGFAHASELTEGQLVVHYQHGIAYYRGLKLIELGSLRKEMLELEYADNDKLFVPHTEIRVLSPYACLDPNTVELHKLGQPKWQKQREKAYEHAQDQACALLAIYAQREHEKGFAYQITEHYVDFSEAFPFEETPDQQRAIKEVLKDMQAPLPMDRLVCGDVGFGKTEVALRAAFIAAMNHKQVVFLTPTTLLSQQHYETLLERFAPWPIRVALMTRYANDQKKVLSDLKTGAIDIVIGTHKLLQPSVVFKDLGLVIVDEEHRFGVNQKEALKKIRGQVDILSMTATPIPRTLSMTFQGLRDLSIIATPPARRLSIATFLYQINDEIIRDALERELFRGGQVYYIFNDISQIDKKVQHLQRLVPKATIGVIHGKMTEVQMERIMAQFYHQRLDILVCTTIVETGIDVPSANTMLIEDAHLFGLSQLHQLRGRVGRSYHQAYAYLLVPVPLDKLSTLAHSRLEVLTHYQDLGSGFHLATHDLELRGAGELLGENQSGHVQDIGIDLYKQLLERAKSTLEGTPALPQESDIELYLNAYISDAIIQDPPLRLKLYQQWQRAVSIETLEQLRLDFLDRFGPFDELTLNWHRLNVARVHATSLGLERIKFSPTGLQLTIAATTPCFNNLIFLVQKGSIPSRIINPTTLEFKCKIIRPSQRLDALESLLSFLLGKTDQWTIDLPSAIHNP